MKPIHPATSNDCGLHERAVSYFTGEIISPEFTEHLHHCASCRAVGTVMQRLRSLPEAKPSANLTANILAAIQPSESKVIRPRFHKWAAAAAAVVIGTASTGIWLSGMKSRDASAQQSASPIMVAETDQSRDKALDWFCRTQEANGSWSATRWGGDQRFEVALTALPMLAILSADGELTGQRNEVITKAKQYLNSACDTYGSFGPQFNGSGYNQGIATLAMLACYKHQPDPESKRLLDNALSVVVARQHKSGWWGVSNTPQQNLSISLWQVEALKLAVNLGWNEVQPYLTSGMDWVETQAASASTPLVTIDSGAEIDYFDAYFATTRLKEVDDESSRHRLASIRHSLLKQQIHNGIDAGSWTPDARWGQVGGRLYTTALASLALN